MVGPDVVEASGREERRRMSKKFTAAPYWEKHLHTTWGKKHAHTLGSFRGLDLIEQSKILSRS